MSEYYSTRYSFNADRKKIWSAICEYLQKYIPESSTVLDLGSGYGDFINNIEATKKIAIDINPEAKQYYNQDVIFLPSPVDSLAQVKSEEVDVVFASNLFEHLDDEQIKNTLLEVRRILKKNGRLIILQPNFYYAYREYFDDYTHKKIFTHISLADLLQSFSFESIRVYRKFLPFSFKSRLPKSYWLTKLYLLFPYKPFAKQMLLVFKK